METDGPQARTEIILGGTDYSGLRGSELYELVRLHIRLGRAAREKEREG
jgi:hypothetical protein